MSSATVLVPPSLAEAWDDLAERTGASPFLRPGWFEAWWGAFGSGRPRLITVERSGRLVGVLPVAVRGGEVRSASNWDTPAYGAVAQDADAVREVAGRVAGLGARRVTLRFVPRAEPLVDAIRSAAESHGQRTLVRVLERSPFVDTEGSIESYMQDLPPKHRAEVRRRRRRLEDRGEVRLDVEAGRDGLDALLEEGFRVEAAGWKATRKTAIASRPETRRFYADVARWAASTDRLRLAFLRVDGRAVAFDFCLESEGRHYLLKTGFDPSWSALAPGMLLRSAMIERAFHEGLASYEFLGADEPWKLQWTRDVRELVSLQVFARSPLATVQRLAETHGRPVGSRVRKLVRAVARRR